MKQVFFGRKCQLLESSGTSEALESQPLLLLNCRSSTVTSSDSVSALRVIEGDGVLLHLLSNILYSILVSKQEERLFNASGPGIRNLSEMPALSHKMLEECQCVSIYRAV